MSGTRLRAAYVVRGDSVNMAARLMQHAEPGEILLGPALVQALGAAQDLGTRRAVRLKGWSEPVDAWSLGVAAGPAAPASRSPLVGRQVELGLVKAAIDTVAGGSSRLVSISGEPGIGKSHLLDAAVDAAGDASFQVLRTGGNPIDQSTPYRAWIAVFEALLGAPGEALSEAELERILAPLGADAKERAPLLGAVLPVSSPETETTRWMSPEARQESTQTLLAEMFSAHRTAAAAILVVDDAQWLDSASWSLLLRLARQAKGLLVIVAARSETETESRSRALLSLPGAIGIELAPLTGSESLAAISAALGVDALPGPVAKLIVERAGGNPLFALEAVYALRDAGALRIEAGACTLAAEADLADLEVPATVEGLVAHRVDQLSPAGQAMLKAGSVLARPFAAEELTDLTPAESTPGVLDELEARDLLVSDGAWPRPSYSFKHDLIRDAVYGRLLEGQRRELHRRAALQYEDRTAVPRGLLAHHWEQAGVVDRALDHLEQAGQDSLRQGAFEECMDLLERALALATRRESRVTPLREAGWRWQAAQAHYRLGNLERSRELAEQAVAVFDRPLPTGPRLPLAVAGQVLRQLLHRLASKPVLTRLGAADSGRLLPAARAYLNLAEVYYLASRKGDSAYAALRGLNIAEMAGPSPELAETYGAIAIICGLVGRPALAERYLRLGFGAADELGAPYARAIVLHQASLHRSGTGGFDSVFRDEAEAAREFRRLGDKGRVRDCLAIAGVAATQAGKLDLAERLLAELLATRDADEGFLQDVWASTWLGAVAIRQGRAESGAGHLEHAAAMQSSALLDANAVTIHGLLALAYHRTGREEAAREEAERTRELIVKTDGRPTVHAVLDGYAALCQLVLEYWDAAGDHTERRLWERRAGEACRFLRRYAGLFPIGEPARWLYEGERQLRLGRRARAISAWRRCEEAARRLGMLTELERAEEALAAA